MMLCVSVLIAGCQTNRLASNCAGWQVVPMKKQTRDYLIANDRDMLLAAISNNENGLDSGCWR
jgi:hypothetical protein